MNNKPHAAIGSPTVLEDWAKRQTDKLAVIVDNSNLKADSNGGTSIWFIHMQTIGLLSLGQVRHCDRDNTLLYNGVHWWPPQKDTYICTDTCWCIQHSRSALNLSGRANISLSHTHTHTLSTETHNRLVGRGKWVHAWVHRAHKEHRNSNHAHCMCVCVCCRCPCWLIACSFVVQLSQIPPFSPSTPLPSLSFFLFSFILSLPRSASPKTHSLLATKAFSAKNKWPSHDKQDKIWFNYTNLLKEFRVRAQVHRATAWGCDLFKVVWSVEACRCSTGFTSSCCVYNENVILPLPESTDEAR